MSTDKESSNQKTQASLPEEQWQEIQRLLVEMAHSLTQNLPGDQAENLEKDIQALEGYTPQAFPEDWASTQYNLANVYGDRICGDRAENLEQAIAHYQQALEVYTRQAFPEQWAATQHNLALAYSDRIRGEKAENIEKAIAHYQRALEVYTREDFSEDWAMTQNKLASAYYDRIQGDRGDNIELAIGFLKKVLEVYTLQAYPEKWAATKHNLAITYQNRIHGSRAENIEQAIHNYQQALEVRTLQAFPKEWASTHNNLGNAYRDRICGESAENIELSISHCLQALEVRTRQAFPEQWAETKYNLSAAYQNRIRGNRAENIEQAILHCQQALEIYTYQTFPDQWADTQTNLANAFAERIRGDRAENIEQAIGHYQQALKLRTLQAFPERWANIQNNLATAYADRIWGDHAENTEQAIGHFQQALEVHTRQAFPEQWAGTKRNLALAYFVRTRGERAENLEQAKGYDQQALEIYIRQAYPEYWARTQNSMANVYANRIRGERAENIEQAIYHYQQALEVYTREAFPEQWAVTQNNIAAAFSDRILGDRAENTGYAIGLYLQTLEFWTPQTDPVKCRSVGRNLSRLCLENERWREAAAGLEKADEADQVLYQAALSQIGKESELSESRSIYVWAAYAQVKIGSLERAVELLEAGRARMLRDALEQNRRDLTWLEEIGHGDLLKNYQEASSAFIALNRQAEVNLTRSETISGKIIVPDLHQQRETTQAKLYQTIEAIQEVPGYANFMRSLRFEQIQVLADEALLVYLTTSEYGGLALVVTDETTTPLWLERMKEDSLREELFGSRNQEQLGGYLSAYRSWRQFISDPQASDQVIKNATKNWHQAIDEVTHWLWEAGMGEVVQCLREKGCSQAVLIPGGMLGLLPLHAAWTEDNKAPTGRRYALDDICFSYAPSAHALQSAQQGADRPMDRLLAVDNPDGSLHFSQEEVDTAVSWFQAEQVCRLVKEENTLERVKEEMGQANVLHFSTHGIAGFDEPLESFLLMAGEDKLTLREILEMDLENARLAILSACETGIPGTKLPDEVISLPTGLIQAGVPGVIGSLWSVSDVSTMLLVGRFYDLWQAGKGKEAAEALRGAQIWLRDTTNEEKKAYLKAVQSGGVKVRIAEGTVEVALTELLLSDLKERSFTHPFHWAAFGFTGV